MSDLATLGYQEIRRAMGVTCTITVHAHDPASLTRRGHQTVSNLERLWSRFLHTSDITRLNNSAGLETHVDTRTVDLLSFMKEAHQATGGRFNPTLLPMQRERGDMRSLTDDGICVVPADAKTWESLDALELLDEQTVRMPQGMTIDAGGVGKGYVADMVVDDLLRNGAVSVSVNLGGDARVASRPDHAHDWNFDVIDHTDGPVVSTISLRQGAIATSSMNARHRDGNGPTEHLVSLVPSTHGPSTVSVISGEARWAEVLTKKFFFSDSWARDVTKADMAVLAVGSDGTIVASAQWKEFAQ